MRDEEPEVDVDPCTKLLLRTDEPPRIGEPAGDFGGVPGGLGAPDCFLLPIPDGDPGLELPLPDGGV